MKRLLRALGLVFPCLLACPAPAPADCSTVDDPIDTDRPDTPDDSPVVPSGSLQIENGVGVARGAGATTLDLPETRLRLGLRSCVEMVVDLPNHVRPLSGGAHGFGDLAPGIKYQFEEVPDPLQLWGAAGVALPTGDQRIAGRGAMPYLQIPASIDLTDALTLAAQYRVTFHPGDVDTAPEHQASLDFEADLSERLGLFLEYTGTYRRGAAPIQTADIGATYRLAEKRQIDVLIGTGLDRAAPDWYFTLGYSFRFDRLF
jgi:hypothetical protein